MLSVLLVDDEPGAIKALKYAIDWESEGFLIAGEAADGEQALELIKEKAFAVVFSDIRMPEMDGLELLKQLQAYPRLHTIAVSGYEDFGYVKQCLKFGVKDYLLKPCKEEDLLPLIRKVKAEIESDIVRDKQRTIGVQAARSDSARQWVHGRIPYAEAEHMFKWCGIHIPVSRTWTAIAAELDALDLGDPNMTAREWQTITFAVRNVLEEIAKPVGGVFEDEQGRLGFVLPTSNMQQVQTAELVHSFHDAVMKYTKVQLTFGVGTSVTCPEDTPDSYLIALAMLDRKFMLGTQAVILPGSMPIEKGDMSEGNRQFINEMLNKIQSGDHNDAIRLLCDLVDIWKRSGTSKEDVQAVIVEWLVGLYHDARQYGEQGEHFFQEKASASYRAILQSRSVDQMIRIVRQVSEEWADFLEVAKWNQPSNPVHEVKRLIEARFAEQISLKILAEQIHMNAAYLGQLFKAAEGMGFNDYLLQYRMNKSRELLINTDLKVYEVAMSVGYKQLDWFYKKFKETFGASANELRSQQRHTGMETRTCST